MKTHYFCLRQKISELSEGLIRPYLYLKTVLEVINKKGKHKSKNDSTARYHSVRSFSPRPNSRYPPLHTYRFIFIVSTLPKYLHLMNFHFGSLNHTHDHYIWRNPEQTKNKTLKIGHLSRAKLGPKTFYQTQKPGTVQLGPYIFHMFYGKTTAINYKMGEKRW